MRLTEAQLRSDAQLNVDNERVAISNAVESARHLPVSLATHPHIVETLLAQPDLLASWSLKSNHFLETLSDAAGASLLYIIDSEGITRASSNWRSNQSLIGNEYRFRPYFQIALRGEESRYYAVGATTGEAGYYFAQPVWAGKQIIGVAVVKIELESLQTQWLEKPIPALLIDEHGVVIMASKASWRFRSTRNLVDDQIAIFNKQRKYANNRLEPLDTVGVLTSERIRLDNKSYLINRANLPLQRWQILQLTPVSPIYSAGLVSILVTSLISGLSFFGFLYRRERQRKIALTAAAMDASTMRALNRQLQAEMSDRQKAQEELKNAQNELIQASKLAALGQMSAAIAHEVNQPLSAIRTYSASAKVLLERHRLDEVGANLDEIKMLTERLATLTTDLKTFARKSDFGRDPISLQTSIKSVQAMLKAEIEANRITLVVDMPEQPTLIMGNAIRIEQVLTNLIRNAMDSTKDAQQHGFIQLSLSVENSDAVIRVQDNGLGLDDSVMEHLFEPFFTTKPMGEGVGLGLAISFGIVEEAGGQFRVRNTDEGGALFSVRLPLHT